MPEYDEIVYRIFEQTKEQIPKATIERVLTAYAWIKVADAIGDAKPKPDDA